MNRDAFEKRQSDVVRALVANGPVPDGFSPLDLARAASSLLAKRRDSLAHRDPSLIKALGTSFGPLFEAFADARPLDAEHSDFEGFLRFLQTAHDVSDEALRRVLTHRLRWWRPLIVRRSKNSGRFLWVCRRPL